MPCLTQHTERKRENDESFSENAERTQRRYCESRGYALELHRTDIASACISFKFLRFAFKTNSPECESFVRNPGGFVGSIALINIL